MSSQFEHANISVTDIDGSILFLSTAMPDFKVRHDSGPGENRWVHIGSETSYICLNRMKESDFKKQRHGCNHLGFAVADAGSLKSRMLEAGYREGYVPKPHPNRKRVYILDNDGIEYEFVEYFSDDPAERNDYSE